MDCPAVYNYLDYRAFLKDLVEFRKQQDSKYSYRYFSGKAGFSSTNFISLVVKGKRNLTNGSISQIAKGLGLKKKEREFFENLVFMNQASTHDEKNYYYKRMMAFKPFTESSSIDKSCYEYFSNWYYPVIREIVSFNGGK